MVAKTLRKTGEQPTVRQNRNSFKPTLRETMENTAPGMHAPMAVNVTVGRPVRPREYLTEREIEKLIKAAGGNRWGHRDATAILVAYRHGLQNSGGVMVAKTSHSPEDRKPLE